MGLCELVSSWSEDSSRKVGSVIVSSTNEVLSLGYNGLPRGVDASHPSRHERSNGEKYHWYEHAERNAIFNAARNGVSLRGARIYSNVFPCADCSRAIIQTGIIELITMPIPQNDLTYGRSFEVSKQMFNESGLIVRFINPSTHPTNHTPLPHQLQR